MGREDNHRIPESAAAPDGPLGYRHSFSVGRSVRYSTRAAIEKAAKRPIHG